MKVLGVTSAQKIAGPIKVRMLLQRPDADKTAAVLDRKIVLPAVEHFNFSPTDVVDMITNESFDPLFTQDQSSSKPLSATNLDLNIVSHPDSVAQEMIQNLRSSMSISGDDTRDITLPDNNMGTAAALLVEKKELEDRFPTLAELKAFHPPLDPKDPMTLEQPEGQAPIPPPMLELPGLEKEYKARKTTNESSLIAIPPDQIYAPNHPTDRPLVQLPGDVELSSSFKDMHQLEERQTEIERAVTQKRLINLAEKQEVIDKNRPLNTQKDEDNDPLRQLEESKYLGEFQYLENKTHNFPTFNDNINVDLASILATTLL
jgi:hypothetical protein